MRRIAVCTYLYDRILQFYFGKRIKWFDTIGEAKEYRNKEFPIREDIYPIDSCGETRCKRISCKYVMYIEIELW